METQSKIYKNVRIGKNADIDAYCVIGKPPVGKKDGELATIIGDNAVIRSHTVIYAGTTIGNGFQTGSFASVREDNKIGDDVSVGTAAIIEKGCVLENGVRLHSRVFLPEYATLREKAWIGPGAILTNAPHPLCPKAKECMRGPTVEKDAKVGAGAIIMPFITIGENSLVGAGALVTKDVPRNAVVAGAPAKVIKNVNDLECPLGLMDSPYKAEVAKAKRIPQAQPGAGLDERLAVQRVLSSRQYVKGPECKEFEKEFAEYCGVSHAVGVNSGTSALFLALLGADVSGKEVITTPTSFVATANTIVLAGAKPVFVDVEADTLNFDVSKLEAAVTKKTAAIIPVHLYGHPTDMDAVMRVADAHDLFVLEDCAQAHGAEYNKKKVGGIGQAACFSFFPTKNLNVCGDGGMAITNDQKFYEKLLMLRNAGRLDKDESEIFGFNNRLSEVQAAIGRVQLQKLDFLNDSRRKLAAVYDKRLKKTEKPVEKKYAKHVYYQYVIQTDKRDELKAHLKQKNIDTGIHYPKPIHLQKAFVDKYGFKEGAFPVTERVVKRILSLPMFPTLTEQEAIQVSDAINQFYENQK